MDHFFEMIQRIGIFIVLSQTLLHFRPSEEYEKYIRILSNIMILAMFVIPIMGLFQKDIGKDFIRQTKRYEQQMEQVELPEDKLNLSMDDSIEEEIKTRLYETEPEGYEVREVTIEENECLVILLEESGKKTGRIQVEKIKIEKKETEETEKAEVHSSMLQDYKAKCADILGIGEAYVEVVVDD